MAPSIEVVGTAVANYRRVRNAIRGSAQSEAMAVPAYKEATLPEPEAGILARRLDRIWEATKLIRAAEGGEALFQAVAAEQLHLDEAMAQTLKIDTYFEEA